jgi:hypothetical protein
VRGLRKVQRAKPPRERPGLDDPKHLAKVRALPCLIRGKHGVIRKWVGRYPHTEQVDVEVQHVCSGASDPHHTTRKSQRGHDHSAVPLCRAAHDLLHSWGAPEFEAVWEIDLKAELRRLSPSTKEPQT